MEKLYLKNSTPLFFSAIALFGLAHISSEVLSLSVLIFNKLSHNR